MGKYYNLVTPMVIRPLDDPTRCAQSVVADLQLLGLGYVEVGDGDEHIRLLDNRFLLAPH